MKNIKYYIMALLALPLMASCNDDDYDAPTPKGNPVMSYTAPTEAVLMGDEVEVKVNCKDEGGVALSNLKATLLFSGQSVDETTVRTKEPGEYTVKLKVPYEQYVPDGQVDVQLTLQNVSTKANTETFSFNIERPHFTNLQFITSTGEKYDMTETADHQYKATVHIDDNEFKGHFATADGKFEFGSNGSTIDLGETGDFEFASQEIGDVDVTFNSLDYTTGPTDVVVTKIDVTNDAEGSTWVGTIKQGATCLITADGNALPDDWYYDTDWFTKNADGTYTFNAIKGRYTIQADFEHKAFRIWTMDGNDPMTLDDDGTGAIWIIGSEGVYKPFLDVTHHGWWTGTSWDMCLTPIKEKVYQITLTVGKQLKASDVNFKFYGAANWSPEFKGKNHGYLLSTTSEVFGIGTGKEADGNGHDNGNVFLQDGVELQDGDTYVFTVDLSEGVDKGVLKVAKK